MTPSRHPVFPAAWFLRLSLALLLAAAVPAAFAVDLPRSFTEDFTTREFYNSSTSCVWDTVAGEIRLPNFQLDYQDHYDTPGEAKSVVVGNYLSGSDRLAFVADGPNGLVILDFDYPQYLSQHGQVDTPGDAWDVAVSGDYAYIGDSGGGLIVVDISTSHLPFVAGSYDTPGIARGLAIQGDLAAVAWDNSGVKFVDITDPTSPSYLGTYATSAAAMDVALAGDLAYVTARGAGLIILDITDPANPSYLGGYDTAGDCWGVAVDGNHVYLGDGGNGFLAIDATDPTNPILVDSRDLGGSARGVTVDGDFAFVADYGRTNVFDISDPTSIEVVYSLYNFGVASATAVEGEYLLIADGNAGVMALKHQAFSGPFWVDSVPVPSSSYAIAVQDDYAYLASSGAGLSVVDIHDTDNLAFVQSVDSYTSSPDAEDLAIAGDHLYLCDSSSSDPGLYVFDISDPASPLNVGYARTGGEPKALALSGDFVFFTLDPPDSMLVFNVSDPENPILWGGFESPTGAYSFYGLAVEGNYAYLQAGYWELLVIDVSNPAWPQQVSRIDLPYAGGGRGRGVEVAGDYVILSGGSTGVVTVDVSDPTSPWVVATIETPEYVSDLALCGNYLFVTNSPAGVRVIDISDVNSPVLLDDLHSGGGGVAALAAAGDRLFGARSGSGGLSVMEIFQRDYETEDNSAGSITVAEPDHDIVRAAVTAIPSYSGVDWWLTADRTYSNYAGRGGGIYYRIDHPGRELRWWTYHTIRQRGVNPTCTEMRIDWLHTFAIIDSIEDVPDDQGGLVRVNFTRSGYDFADEPVHPVTAYDVFRRIDDPGRVADLPEADLLFSGDKSLPPGTWEAVGHVPALQEQQYICPVPTLADSSDSPNHEVFCVVASTTTPSVYYVSLPDSGYSVDNLAPAAPTGFTVVYRAPDNELSWAVCPEEDCGGFRVYRGTSPDFVPGPENLVQETSDTVWTDPEGAGWDHHYLITAFDHSQNESEPTEPQNVVGVEDPGSLVPARFALHQNSPNPFNPRTVIRFELPSAQEVRLEIFALDGTRVARPVVENLPAGRHEVMWKGVDDAGRAVASGTYIYRLVAGTFNETRRMVLVR